jgi:hypothetical protein
MSSRTGERTDGPSLLLEVSPDSSCCNLHSDRRPPFANYGFGHCHHQRRRTRRLGLPKWRDVFRRKRRSDSTPPDCYCVYDTGLITVNGFAKSTTYGRTSTETGLASALATAFNSDASSPVTATVSSKVITLRSKVAGPAGNYPLSVVSYTDWPEVFSPPSFTAAASGPALTGGTGGVPAVPVLNQPTAGANGTSATITWGDVATETAYYLERCAGASCTTNFTPIGSPLAANTTTYADTGLTPGSTYGYRIRAYNAAGYSGYSSPIRYVTMFNVPAAPTINPVVRGSNGTTATVSWTDVATETAYYLERCAGANCTTNFTPIGSPLSANTTTYLDSGLTSGQAYGYRVRASNAVGYSGYSSIAYVTMYSVPITPSSITGTFNQATVSINIVWTDNATDETGYVVERCPSSGCVDFAVLNDSLPPNSAAYTDTSIATNTVYRYRVRAVNSVGSSGYATSGDIGTNVAPTISGFSPVSGPVGTSVTITGSGFGAVPDGSTVAFNGTPAPLDGWSDTSISVRVPPTAVTGRLSVTTAGGQANSDVDSTVIPSPVIANISPNPAGRGTLVTISGTGFSSEGSVSFNGTVGSIVDWTDTSIILYVPDNATSGSVTVTTNELTSNPVEFAVSPPAISALEPVQGLPGQLVTLTGSGFGVLRRDSTVSIGGTSAPVVNWSAESITVTIPSEASSGSVDVVATVDEISSNAVSLFISKPLLLSPSNYDALR